MKCSNKTLKCDRLFSTLGVSLRFTLQQLLVSAEHGNNVVTKSIDTSDRLNRGLLLAPFQLILRSAHFLMPKTVLMLGLDTGAVSAPRLSLCDVRNTASQSYDIVISFSLTCQVLSETFPFVFGSRLSFRVVTVAGGHWSFGHLALIGFCSAILIAPFRSKHSAN